MQFKHNIFQLLVSLDQFLNVMICMFVEPKEKHWADGSSTSATNQATSSFNKQSVNVSVTVTTNNGEITDTGSLKCSY